MDFIKLQSAYGDEIAVNMGMVSEIIVIPKTNHTRRHTRLLYNFMIDDDYAYTEVIQTVNEILLEVRRRNRGTMPQAKRAPLTEEQISELNGKFGYFNHGDAQGAITKAFVWEIERLHGIGEVE